MGFIGIQKTLWEVKEVELFDVVSKREVDLDAGTNLSGLINLAHLEAQWKDL